LLPAVVDTPLTARERRDLELHEQKVERAREAMLEAGESLRAIRDQRLYRENFRTFEEYVRERWPFAVRQAHRMCKAAETVKELKAADPETPAPARESQARELNGLEPAQKAEAWREARAGAKAAGREATARDVRAVVAARWKKRREMLSAEEPKEEAGGPKAGFAERQAWLVLRQRAGNQVETIRANLRGLEDLVSEAHRLKRTGPPERRVTFGALGKMARCLWGIEDELRRLGLLEGGRRNGWQPSETAPASPGPGR
jgi:hypothetical protein